MNHYLIIVEGAHDIAVIEKVLRINGVNQKIASEDDLPEIWKRTIPSSYPFHDGRLERISPIPSFVKNGQMSVAIKNAGSDSEIVPTLLKILKLMEIKDVRMLSGIMLICDADARNAVDKQTEILENGWKGAEYILDVERMELEIYKKIIPIFTFVFPDNENPGNLENLLLDAASIAYPELLELAEEYINDASKLQSTLKREQDRNKAKVGCIANVMKPGKANQVSIADNDWVSEKTLKSSQMLGRLNEEIKKMCGL